MKYFFLVIGLMLSAWKVQSQEHEIVGFAPSYVGEKVTLYTYQDYVTMTKIKLSEGVVSEADSLFHLPLDVGATIKGLIEIDKTEAPLYVAPKTSYNIYFPEPEQRVISFQNQHTDLLFYGLDTTDINYLILQYNQWFDAFIAYNEVGISQQGFLPYLDTFMVYASDAYQEIEDEYFITYVRYNVAEMQQTLGGKQQSKKRLQTYLNYIDPFPLYYENDQYMKFFRGFYSKKFSDFPPKIEATINVAIDRASPTRLMAALKQDLFLSNPEIRELVMIDQLGKQYYARNDQKRNIIMMLDSLEDFAKYQVNRTVAKNVKSYITNLEPGFPAPYIEFTDQEDTTKAITWHSFRGKFVYLNFFETWNNDSRSHMRIIKDLKKKYGEYIIFISVSTDRDEVAFEKYMREHPDYDWNIFHVGSSSDLQKDFRVKVVPSYFLIDQSGFIAEAPAPSPAPDGEYESIDKTFFYIKRALTPTDGKGVGEP